MIAVLLDIVANPILRRNHGAGIPSSSDLRVTVRFLEGRIQTGNGIGDGRRIIGQLDQLVPGHSQVAKQHIGKYLDQRVRPGLRAASLGREAAHVDFILLRQLQQQCGRNRPLVALQVIEVAGADGQARRHIGLRHLMVAAEAAETVA